jgi:Tfp pilus assembly protein PilV
METALTTIIVGLAVVALVKMTLNATQQNRYSERLTRASILADNCREMMAALPFNDPASGTTTFGPQSGKTLATFVDVDDFDGFDSTNRPDLASSAPKGVIDANRQVITATIGGVTQVPDEWLGWRQQIAVDPVDQNNVTLALPKPDTARTVVRVTVTVSKQIPGSNNYEQILQMQWLKARL